MNITINKNSSNGWTATGFAMAVVLCIVTLALMKESWPPSLVFEWILFLCLLTGALIGIFIYALWLISPRNFSIEIENDYIKIIDKPYFKTKSRIFNAGTIISINHFVDSISYIKTTDGKCHTISDILMMKKKEIFKVIQEIHPHIKCNSDVINATGSIYSWIL